MSGCRSDTWIRKCSRIVSRKQCKYSTLMAVLHYSLEVLVAELILDADAVKCHRGSHSIRNFMTASILT